MTESQLYEKIGRLQTEKDAVQAGYDRLLKVFGETLLASRPTPDADEPGKCNPLRILINLTDGTYQWSGTGSRPATPATINGLPVIVMAPDEPPDERNDAAGPPQNGDGHANRIKGLLEPSPE